MVQTLKLGLHVTFFESLFSPFKNGFNPFLWYCSHMKLQNVIKIKGAADKNGPKNVTYGRTPTLGHRTYLGKSS